MDYSPQGSVCGISQERILEWVAISFSKRSSWPRDRTWVSFIAGGFLTNWATKESCGWLRTKLIPHPSAATEQWEQKVIRARRAWTPIPPPPLWADNHRQITPLLALHPSTPCKVKKNHSIHIMLYGQDELIAHKAQSKHSERNKLLFLVAKQLQGQSLGLEGQPHVYLEKGMAGPRQSCSPASSMLLCHPALSTVIYPPKALTP